MLLGCFASLLVLALTLASCTRDEKLAIEGTYASQESGEYSISRDTLVIMPYGDEGDYQVIRKSSFVAVRSGKLQPREQKIREYVGHLEEKTRTLVIDSQGRKISFFPGKNSLFLMQREYKKVER